MEEVPYAVGEESGGCGLRGVALSHEARARLFAIPVTL